ncbi:hypothetical protein GOV08_04080 [Candidatus Woesearchaeota archaeon]|nr:hypothetical protein [Candidatus Woesearchaeota archaeon]
MTPMSDENYFKFSSGRFVKSIEELAIIVPQLSEEEFQGYVKREDFAHWVQDVFKNSELAHELRRARLKSEFLAVINEFILEEKEEAQKIHQPKPAATPQTPQQQTIQSQEPNQTQPTQIKQQEPEVKQEETQAQELKPIDNGLAEKEFGVQIEAYNARLKELKEMISEVRKEGKDPYMANLKLKNIPSKIHLAEVTRRQTDLDLVRDMLAETEKELREAMDEKITNVKKEVEEGAIKLLEEEDRAIQHMDYIKRRFIKAP